MQVPIGYWEAFFESCEGMALKSRAIFPCLFSIAEIPFLSESHNFFGKIRMESQNLVTTLVIKPKHPKRDNTLSGVLYVILYHIAVGHFHNLTTSFLMSSNFECMAIDQKVGDVGSRHRVAHSHLVEEKVSRKLPKSGCIPVWAYIRLVLSK